MNKIGIITLQGNKNFGNKLQNYALQELIKELGLHPETIIIAFRKKKRKNICWDNNVFNIVRKIKNKGWEKGLEIINKKRFTNKNEKFKNFSNDYIVKKNISFEENASLKEIANEYKYFIVGSDQVWNPFLIEDIKVYFLAFAPSEKRIAYAASFGISNIPKEFKKIYKQMLGNMANISVREKAGIKIVKELANRKAILLMDPTLMLKKDKWAKIAKKSKHKPKEKYLLSYFLGKIKKEDYFKMKKIAKQENLQLVELASLRDKKRFTTDPCEFIDYIKSASLVFTDSFHGTIFSILFNRPFVVFERISSMESMNSRLETLLTSFKFNDRKWESLKDKNEIMSMSFAHVDIILEKEREKSIIFLKKALQVKE